MMRNSPNSVFSVGEEAAFTGTALQPLRRIAGAVPLPTPVPSVLQRITWRRLYSPEALSAEEIKDDIQDGVQDAARRAEIAELTTGEMDRLFDIIAEPARTVSVHPGQEGNAQVDFGKAEKPPPGLHETKVKGAGQDRPAGKGMPVDGGHGQKGVGQQPEENTVEEAEKILGGSGLTALDQRRQPLQVDAVGKNFFMGRTQHQGAGIGPAFDLVQDIEKAV